MLKLGRVNGNPDSKKVHTNFCIPLKIMKVKMIILLLLKIQGLISAVSPQLIQSAVKCHCYLTQKQHTTVMQPVGAKTTQGTMTSHYFGQKRKSGIYFRV
jgi:hypothetical protein